MAEPQTYAELQASIASWLNRDDLTDNIPEFIALAERHLGRQLHAPEREEVATLTASTETVALPADFEGARSLYLDTNPKVVLEQLPLGELRRLYATAATHRPLNYAIQGSSIVLGPAPDTSYDLILDYYQAIPALSDSNADNWLLLANPDLYLAAALVEGFNFLMDEARAIFWKARRDEKVADINKAGQRKMHSAAPMVRKAHIPSIRNIRA